MSLARHLCWAAVSALSILTLGRCIAHLTMELAMPSLLLNTLLISYPKKGELEGGTSN